MENKDEFKPLSYEQADQMADSVMALMSLEEKIDIYWRGQEFSNQTNSKIKPWRSIYVGCYGRGSYKRKL